MVGVKDVKNVDADHLSKGGIKSRYTYRNVVNLGHAVYSLHIVWIW